MPFRPPRVSIAFVIWYEPERGFGLLSFLFLPLFHFISLPLLGSHFCLFSPSSCFLFFHLLHFLSLPAFLWPPFFFSLFFRPVIFFSFPFLLSLSLIFGLIFPLLSFPFLYIYLNLFSHCLSSPCSYQFFFPFLSFLSSLSSLSFHILPSCSYSFPFLTLNFLLFPFFLLSLSLFLPLHFLHSPLFLSYFLSRLLALQLNWNTWLTWQMKIPNACHSYFSIPHPLAFIACPQHRSIHLLTKWWRRAALSAAAAAHSKSSIHLGPNCVNISFSLNGQNRLEL